MLRRLGLISSPGKNASSPGSWWHLLRILQRRMDTHCQGINQGLFAAGKKGLQHSGSDVTGKDEAGKDGGGCRSSRSGWRPLRLRPCDSRRSASPQAHQRTPQAVLDSADSPASLFSVQPLIFNPVCVSLYKDWTAASILPNAEQVHTRSKSSWRGTRSNAAVTSTTQQIRMFLKISAFAKSLAVNK